MAGIAGISVVIVAQMPVIDVSFALLVIIGMMLLYGFVENSWICQKLEKVGYMLIDKVEAANKDGAKGKIFNTNKID